MNRTLFVEHMRKVVLSYGEVERVLVRYLTWWFDKQCQVPLREDVYDILPSLLDEAMQDLRSRTDDITLQCRSLFLSKTNWKKLPELNEVSYTDATRHHMILLVTGIIDKAINDEALAKRIHDYFYTQDTLLDQVKLRFVRYVWRAGLSQLAEAWNTSMRGRFGRTTLLVELRRDAKVLTFIRELASEKYDDGSISLVIRTQDPHGYSAILGNVSTVLVNALEMIQEVIEYWPEGSETQRMTFREIK